MILEERERIEAQKRRVWFLQRGRCYVCGKNLREPWDMAHRIPKHDKYLKKYGGEVIHHRFNIRGTCRGACNDAVLLDPATHPVEAGELIAEIMEDLKCH